MDTPTFAHYIGYAAGVLTTFAYVPQVLRLWRTRSADDISLPAFLMLSTGIFLWLVYGIFQQDGPLVAANGIGLTLTVAIAVMKARFRKQGSANRHMHSDSEANTTRRGKPYTGPDDDHNHERDDERLPLQ